MSASQKKKLRNEQNTVQMTEKQAAEQKEAKKLRIYTAIFSVAIALMLCVVLATTIIESGFIQRHTTVATVGESKISAPEFNYFYVDSVSAFQNQWGNAFMFSGITPETPLDKQVYNEETGETWGDYFMDQATEAMRHTYALYNAAIADGYTVDEEGNSVIDSMVQSVERNAMMSVGIKDLKTYLKAVYGIGSNESTYRSYLEVQYIASQYAMDHMDTLTYTDEQLRAKDNEDPTAFNGYSFNQFYLSNSSFLEGGTKDEEGNVTYSDEEKAAAAAKCEEASKTFTAETVNSVASLDEAIAKLNLNTEGENPKSTELKDKPKTQINSALSEWVTSADRKAGDMTVVPNEITTTDEDGTETTTVNGYYIVLFNGVNDNTNKIANVRHILVKFEGGTQDEATKTVVYSDEEKAAAKAEAEGILAQFEAGETTEEAFAALATEKTDDTASAPNGGLIENIIPSSNLVVNFRNWAVDPSRAAGDTDIVETEYGYHVMYYVGDAELNYRDTMIKNTLTSEDMSAWEDSLVEPVTAEVTNSKYAPTDMVLHSRAQ